MSNQTPSISADPLSNERLPKVDSRRNVFAITGDILFFVTATYFIPPTTVLVGLASKLTDDKVLIGAIGTAWTAMWFLPQLFAAQVVRGKRRQKKYVTIPGIIGRQSFLLFALWLWMTNASQPVLTVWLLLAAISIFNLCDALSGVAWFDMLARAFTPRRRGRVMVFAQMTASFIGIGVGLLIERILRPDGLPFPQNFALVIFCAWFFMTISLISFMTLEEIPMSESIIDHGSNVSLLGSLRDVFKSNVMFRRLLLARLLTGFEAMAATFYLVFAKEKLKLDDSAVGIFTLALTIGAIGGLIIFGWLNERFGPRRVIHASTTFQMVAPALALLVAAVPSIALQSPAIGLAIFIVVMGLRGAIEHSLILGFVGYVMDAAPEQHRAMYVGTVNTVGGIVALAPVMGGLIIQQLSGISGNNVAYAVVFGLTTLCVGLGWLLSLRLPKL